MSGPGVAWFTIFGLGCPIGLACAPLYGGSAWWLLALLLIPVLYAFARARFRYF